MGTTRKTNKEVNNKRPNVYATQQENKASLSLSDFTDEKIFAELRKRGYKGELKYFETINI